MPADSSDSVLAAIIVVLNEIASLCEELEMGDLADRFSAVGQALAAWGAR